MDLKDKKLLLVLEQNSRLSDSEIAKKIGTSKQVVNYRINRFVKENIISQFQTLLNMKSLGLTVYASIYFNMTSINKEKEEEIIFFLVNNHNVGYVGKIGGRYDLSIVITAKDLQDFSRKFDEIVNKYPLELKESLVSIRVSGTKFHKKYLLDEKPNFEKKILSDKDNYQKIDELDKKILKELTKNSRSTIVEISEKLKIPFSTIRIRIKNLENRGIISGYSVLVNLKKIGINNYKIFIKTRDKSEKNFDRLLNYSKNNKNITWFFRTIGNHDYEMRVEVENQEKFQEILKELRYNFSDSIEDIESIIVFDELKEDYSTLL